MVSASDASGLVEGYAYDAEGRLVAVLRPSGASDYFVHNGPKVVGSFRADGRPSWEAMWGPEPNQHLEYRVVGSGEPVVPLLDHRNTPVATWDPVDIEIEELAQYDAYGRLTLLDSTESILCLEKDNPGVVCPSPSRLPFAFNGAWRSPATGLLHMGARWYSPRLGQFTATDPLGYVDAYDLFAFAAFDPVNFFDPWGLVSRGFGCGPRGCGAGFPAFEAVRAGNEFANEVVDPTVARLGRIGQTSADAVSTVRKGLCGWGIGCHALFFGAEFGLRGLPSTRDELYLNLALTVGTAGLGWAGVTRNLGEAALDFGRAFSRRLGPITNWLAGCSTT